MRVLLALKNFALLFGLIGMIWWFHLQNRPAAIPQAYTKPQEYMAGLSITNYNENGKPSEKLKADYWAFVPNNSRSDLRKPHVTVYKPNGDVWFLSSKRALAWHLTMADKITQIDMLENVLIERSAENNAVPTKITTEQMQYFPNEEKINSDNYVQMQQPGLMVSGYGMLGYLDRNWIELHDRIKTVYTPNANKS